MKRALALLALAACTVIAHTAFAARAVYAIAIGNNQPPSTDPFVQVLRYADDDAARFYDLFSRFARRVELLTVLDAKSQTRYPGLASAARPPTLWQLRNTLNEFRQRIQADAQRGEDTALYLSFSGHGYVEPTGEHALAMLDGGISQRVLYDEVLAQFEGINVHLIIDACHAAGVVGSRGAFGRELDARGVELDPAQRESLLQKRRLSRFPNVGALMASSVSEESQEWSRIESGVFTHEVLSGLLGAADVNGDRRIEYSELQAFVSAANRGLPANAAKPSIIAVAPAANQRAPLLELSELRESIVITGIPRDLGHFYIENGTGQRVLDAHFERTQTMTLALPRNETNLFLRTSDREAVIPSEARVALSALRFVPVESGARGSVDNALREGLFTSAYGADYYRGYVDSQEIVPVEFPRRPNAGNSQASATSTAPVAPMDGRQVRSAWPSRVLAVTAGAALVTSTVFGLLAYDRRRDFDRTNKQRQAHELADEYATFGNASIAAAAVGVSAGVGALWLWPRAAIEQTPAHGQLSLQLSFGGQF